ncbi:energy transducer TonB family protein [Ruegeria halocynthiae]|uniref:energy transducer TonB family protein n=1 Tax=Ruegeria halocynthiae TaxID=985054 RepID=UPI000559E43A|nr:energy transducer TonB [Ruegeria halocynthiae]
MIRGSVVIAVLAALVSLLLHLMGLSLTAPRLVDEPREAGAPDTVDLGSSFEDLVESVAEPVEPEPAEAPEPPVEAAPEPEPAEIPTSEVHVASDNPQRTFAPDTGSSEVLQPVTPEPVEADIPETEDTTDGDKTASDDVDETPPVETAEAIESPEGSPEAPTPVDETPAAPQPAETEQLAALPEPTEDTQPSVAPVVPIESEAVEADIPATPVEPVPDAEDSSEGSELAVTSSIRPQLPDRRQRPEPQGVLNGARDFSNLRFPSREIESPLTTYKRRGIDTFTSGDSGARSGGRGPGNSDRTNYAGRVLVHLNRAPVVYTAARGFAKIFFEINPDGTLAWVDVVDSSGTPDVDRAAKAQVRAASPFPLPPGGVSRKLSFVYSSN